MAPTELTSENRQVLLDLLSALRPDPDTVVWRSVNWDYTAADLSRAIRSGSPAGQEWARGIFAAGSALIERNAHTPVLPGKKKRSLVHVRNVVLPSHPAARIVLPEAPEEPLP